MNGFLPTLVICYNLHPYSCLQDYLRQWFVIDGAIRLYPAKVAIDFSQWLYVHTVFWRVLEADSPCNAKYTCIPRKSASNTHQKNSVHIPLLEKTLKRTVNKYIAKRGGN